VQVVLLDFPHRRAEISELHRHGNYSDVEKCWLDNLDFAKSLRGECNDEVYSATLWLSQAYYFQGNYPESTRRVRTAMELARRLYGETSRQFVGCLSNLGRLQYRMSLLDEARDTLAEACKLIPHIVEDRECVEGAVLVNRARLLMASGDLETPERLLLRAIQLAKNEYGAGSPRQATCLDHLSDLYLARQNLPAAERVIRKAIAIFQQTGVELSPDYAWAVLRFANILHRTGRFHRAQSRVKLADTIVRKVRPLNHPDIGLFESAIERMRYGFPPLPDHTYS
jgi:tetratricopeptide (TPR) repeat protein